LKEKAFAIRDLIRDTNETENPELMTGLLTAQANHNRNCLGRRKNGELERTFER
jgi:hypothetical protein